MAHRSHEEALSINKYQFFTVNEIKPLGWIRRQLEIQANGLSGNLDKIWPDVRDSSWIGGNKDGWERFPYWLDGFVPLAYLLENKDMIARAKQYVEYIISHQRPNGWICPSKEEDCGNYDPWAILLVSKALTVYYECSCDERIPDVIYKIMQNLYAHLTSTNHSLFNWGKWRWFEGFIALNFLSKRYNDEWIKQLARLLHEQGQDYNTISKYWINTDESKEEIEYSTYDVHIVNLGMMFKHEAVSHELLGNEYTDNAEYLYNILNKYHGRPVGVFIGDERLGRINSPIRGTELCAVVEQMYSYEILYAVSGDEKWLERLELVAFNALPATFSDDMWTHQYDQQTNQIGAVIQNAPHCVFRTNGADANIFGLEPNYGCCTANLSQGWPKFVLAAYVHRDGEIVNSLPIPSSLDAAELAVTLKTNYPFENSFEYTLAAKKDIKFTVRIPPFAKNIKCNGGSVTGNITVSLKAGENRTLSVAYETTPEFVPATKGLVSAKCGSLVFSVPVKYEKRILPFDNEGTAAVRKFPYCDYEYLPQSDWNYAYADTMLEIVQKELADIPFSSDQPPVVAIANVCHIDWGMAEGQNAVCAPWPSSRASLDEPHEIELYPYGCTKLRMTELPMIDQQLSNRPET